MNTIPEKPELIDAEQAEQIRKVEEWQRNHMAELERQAPPKPEPAAEKISLPPDPLMQENKQATIMEEAIPRGHRVEVSDLERDLYLKAVLTDEPIRLVIEVLGGNLKLEFRSRTMHEQERILSVVRQDVRDKLIQEGDAALAYTRLQQYCVCLQLRRINEDHFSDLVLPAESSFDKDRDTLRAAFLQLHPKMSQLRWNAIYDGLVTFESKCRQLSEESLNTDFWKPRG